KIHTGRSRNDQVQVVLRLFYKDNLKQIIQLCKDFSDAGKKLTDKHGAIKMPGYTHMQKAMPSSIGLWIGSFSASMEDNIKYLEYVLTLIDQNPLGGAAGFGTPGLEVDKELTAKLLKFAKVQENSLYVQLSRGKFEGIIVSALGAVLLDLNKLATDLMLYTMSEFDFFSLPDNFLTGSSIMPQKKNYDVFELVRGKYHIVLGYEMQLKSICGNLISGYNRDMQLTKEPVMNALEVANDCISIMTLVINNLKVHKEKCEKAVTNELYTTEKAYKMVKQGKTFRDAYHSLK
ncbi:MAG: lyase family protein, partial [Candidatus Woesearchaeota archaeon]|nr:lyase family protein [Candidatus Woesearchaeota archaeon]